MNANHALTADWLREALVRHDPLGAWAPAGTRSSDYAREAEEAVSGMRRILGVGHIWTIVADAIDGLHPGFYRAARADQGELQGRLSNVSREAWDRQGGPFLAARPALQPLEAPPPPAPPVPELIADSDTLTQWLRELELGLEAESDQADRSARTAAKGLREVLPGLVTAYLAATESQREEARLAFSRFRRVLHELGGFAAQQLAEVTGTQGELALRRALLTESLLDLCLDWRDELLLLRDLRQRSRAAGLLFDELVAEAAACSSTRTAKFLLGVVDEAAG